MTDTNGFGRGRKVRTEEDFEDFIGWMTSSARAGERLGVYRERAESDGVPSSEIERAVREGRGLEAVKATVVEEASGDFVRELLERANDFSREGLSPDATMETERFCLREVSAAKRSLSKFLSACAGELFATQMRAANMSEAATRELIRILTDTWGKSPLEALSMATREALGREAEAAEAAFRRYLSEPERRAEILCQRDTVTGQRETDAALGRFAPLVRFMGERLMPSERAEMMARMIAYVESGWARVDMAGVGEEEARAMGPWTGHEALAEWRRQVSMMEEGTAEPAEVMDAFAKRFAELAFDVRVDRKDRTERAWVDFARPLSDTVGDWASLCELAKQRRIDVCMVTPGRERVMLFCATSDALMTEQKDQARKYMEAVLGEVGEGTEFAAAKGARVTMTVAVPCVTQTIGRTAGSKRPGLDVFERMSGMTPEEEDRLVGLINVFPLLEKVAVPSTFGEARKIFDVELRTLGAGQTVWDETVGGGGGTEAEAVGRLCGLAAETMEMLAEHGFSLTTVPRGGSVPRTTRDRLAHGLLSASQGLLDRLGAMEAEGGLQKETRQSAARLGKAYERFLSALSFDGSSSEMMMASMIGKGLRDIGRQPRRKAAPRG